MIEIGTSFITRLNAVRKIPSFVALSWFEKSQIAHKAFFAEYRKGEMIRLEGDPPDFFYCVISGRLQSYTKDGFGNKHQLEYLHRGMYFGIVSLLTGENHSHNFEALNDSMILQVPRSDFQVLLESIPKLAIELSQTLSKHVRKNVKGIQSTFESTIISIYSPTKETGSSTYAMNLALALQKETKKKVILVRISSRESEDMVDSASQADGTLLLKNGAVYLHEIVGDYEKILNSINHGEKEISILNTVFDLTKISPETLKKEIGSFVSALANDYDYVLVDLPTDMDDIVLEALTQSDVVHLMTSDRKKDFEVLKQTMDRLRPALKSDFRQDKVKVLVRPVYDKVYLSFEEVRSIIGYDVYKMLPNIHPSDLEEHQDASNASFLKCLPQSPYSLEMTRIAREIGQVLVGLVLGGGAALGIAHIGVLKVFEKERIPVDVVAGSSMGALIGAFWCAGYKADEIEKIAREFEKRENMFKLLDLVLPISGLIHGRKITQWLRKYLGERTFYSTTIPLKVVAYDLVRRQDLIIETGSVVEAVRRSISIPGVIEPIQEGGRVIIDGGVLNPLPTNVLVDRGIKKIISVNVLQSPEDVTRGVELIEEKERAKEQHSIEHSHWEYVKYRISRAFRRAFTPNLSDIIVRTLQATEYVIAEHSSKKANIALHPDLVGIDWYELDRVNELVRAGEKAALAALPKIKELVHHAS
ncbi:MAG: patatin-like phospholipase family protein [Candidatus Omnitrophica bacterium]|nr:patatin-like phospholipase family protein [Candidatus Omnitrophota bacterium]